MLCSGKRTKLDWKLNPIPSIHTQKALKRSSTLNNPSALRKAPKVRIFQKDELAEFNKTDVITTLNDLTEQSFLPGYIFHRLNDTVLYYKIVFPENGFPTIEEAIKIDKKLIVQLQFNGKPVPLPTWFVSGRNVKLDRFSLLNNFPSHLQSFDEKKNMLY